MSTTKLAKKKRAASSKKHAVAVTYVPRVTCATLADEQRRRVDWQRQGHHPQTKRQARTTTTTTANTMLF